MCVWGFGCCGPPPHATIKAYDASFALEWDDLIDIAPSRESAIAIWPSATPAQAVVAAGPGDGSATREGALLVRDATDGSRHEESTSTPLTAPTPPASQVTLLTDNSTIVWWAQPSRLAAFDASLAQSAEIATSLISAGRNSTNLLVGRRAGSGTTKVLSYFDPSGTELSSVSLSALSVTGGRSIFMASGILHRTGSAILVAGVESTGGSFFRRYWRYTITFPNTLTLVSAVTGGSATLAGVAPFSDLGRGAITNGSQFVAPWPSELAVVSTSTLLELWTFSGETFLAIDATYVYSINLSTNVLTARAVATGTTAWTLDLSGDIVSTSSTWGKILSGGYLAVLTPSSPVALIDVSAGTLVSTIDVGGYDIIEYASRYIVVGPKRTTAT